MFNLLMFIVHVYFINVHAEFEMSHNHDVLKLFFDIFFFVCRTGMARNLV